MADNNKNLSLDELASQYGYAANFFFSDPELTALINQAVKEQWSVAKFQAKFMASNWYRTHSASARQWLEENARDPQTAARQIQQQALKIGQLASTMGVSLDQSRVQQMAKDSLMFGWSDQELKNSIGSELFYSPGNEQGQAGSFDAQIRQTANDYGITMSDDTVGQWVKNLSTGSWTIDNVTSQLRDWAMSRYPGIAQQLAQGQTVRDVADPYLQAYSSVLEVPAGSIQLSDPLIQKALQGTPQPSTGSSKPGGSTSTTSGGIWSGGAITPASGSGAVKGSNPGVNYTSSAKAGPATGTPVAPQSLYDFENALRRDPRWLNTQNAHQSMQSAAQGILKDWGLYS